MNTIAALEHTVAAYNLSAASENKIHDDTVAKKFGFEGGLVPGVEVYAYIFQKIQYDSICMVRFYQRL